jgi:hypothetical protein
MLHCQCDGAAHAGVVAEKRRDNSNSHRLGQDILGEGLIQWTEENVASLGKAATEDNSLWVQQTDGSANAAGEEVGGFGDKRFGIRVAGLGLPEDVTAGNVLRRGFPEALPEAAFDTWAAGKGLKAAATAAGAERPRGVNGNVPDFPCEVLLATDQLAISNNSAADARADVDIDHIATRSSGAELPFTQGTKISVIVYSGGNSEPILE